MSDTSTAQNQPSVVTVVATPQTSIDTTLPVETPVTTVAGAPTNTNVVTRTLAVVSGDYEKAITEFETFVSSGEAFVESFIAAEVAKLKLQAEAQYTKIVSDKQELVNALETELGLVKSWLSDKFKKLVSIL